MNGTLFVTRPPRTWADDNLLCVQLFSGPDERTYCMTRAHALTLQRKLAKALGRNATN